MFLEELDEVISTLNTYSETSRLAILLSSKIGILTFELENLFSLNNLDPKELEEILVQGLTKIEQIIRLFPQREKHPVLFVSYVALDMDLRVKMAQVFMGGTFSKMYSLSNILVEILSGVLSIDDIENLQYSDQDEWKFKSTALKLGVVGAELFKTALQAIPMVAEEEFRDWASQALQRYGKMIEIWEGIDLQKQAKKLSLLGKTNEIFITTRTFVDGLHGMFDLSFFLFQTIVPKKISAFEKSYFHNFQTSLDPRLLQQNIEVYLNKVTKELEKLSRWGVNYSTHKNIELNHYIRWIGTDIRNKAEQISHYQKYLNSSVTLEEINSLVQSWEILLTEIWELKGNIGPDYSYWNWLRKILELLIPAYYIQADLEGGYDRFMGNTQVFKGILEEDKNGEIFFDAKFLLLLSQIALSCKENNKGRLKMIKAELEELISNSDLLLLNQVMAKVLSQLISIVTEGTSEEILDDLEGILEKYFIQGNFEHLSSDFFQYIKTIKETITNTYPSWSRFKERTRPNYRDEFSWLIPDFTNLSIPNNFQKLRYVPYNRREDKVIWK